MVIAFTMFFMHPVSLGISLGSALAYAVYLRGVGTLSLPLHAEGMELSRLFRYRPMYMLGRACGDASPFGERR